MARVADGPLAVTDDLRDRHRLVGYAFDRRVISGDRTKADVAAQLGLTPRQLSQRVWRDVRQYKNIERFGLSAELVRGVETLLDLDGPLTSLHRDLLTPSSSLSSNDSACLTDYRELADLEPRAPLDVIVLGAALASHLAVAPPAARLRDETDARARKTIQHLFRLATGPYGYAIEAHVLLARLGDLSLEFLLPPGGMLVVEDHRQVPEAVVGWKALPALSRMLTLYGCGESGNATGRSATRIRQRIARFLQDHGLSFSPRSGRVLVPLINQFWGKAAGGGEPWAKELLLRIAIDDGNFVRVRRCALWCLCERRDNERQEVLETFRERTSNAGLQHAVAVLERGGADLRTSALDYVSAPGPEYEEVLRNISQSRRKGVRIDKSTESLIVEAILSPSAERGRVALDVLRAAGMSANAAHPISRLMVSSKAAWIREVAVSAVGFLGDRAAGDELVQLVDGEANDAVRHASLWSVGDIFFHNPSLDPQGAVKVLRRVIESPDTDARLRRVALHSLAVIASSTLSMRRDAKIMGLFQEVQRENMSGLDSDRQNALYAEWAIDLLRDNLMEYVARARAAR